MNVIRHFALVLAAIAGCVCFFAWGFDALDEGCGCGPDCTCAVCPDDCAACDCGCSGTCNTCCTSK